MGTFNQFGKTGQAFFAITVTSIAVTYFYGMQYLPAIVIGSAFGAIGVLFAIAATNTPTRINPPAAIPAPTKVEVEIAAQQGSDFYVPTPAEIGDIIKTNVVDNRRQKALILARALVEDYRAKLAATPQTSTSMRLQHELLRDHQVYTLAHEILEQRGWRLSTSYDDGATLSPLQFDTASQSTPEVNSILRSDELKALMEERVHKPLREQAQRLAREIVEAYKRKLNEGTHTSTSLNVTVEGNHDYCVTKKAEEILAQRGWSISHISGASYKVYPSPPITNARSSAHRRYAIF